MEKMNIVLACSGGVSSSMLVNKLIQVGKEKGVEITCNAYAVLGVEKYIPDADLVLIGPQVKYIVKKLQNEFPDKTIEVIDIRDYGSMNAENILNKYLNK